MQSMQTKPIKQQTARPANKRLTTFPRHMCVANSGLKLGNGRNNDILTVKWFGLVSTAD